MSRMTRFTLGVVLLIAGVGLTLAFMAGLTLSIGYALSLMATIALLTFWLGAATPLSLLPRLLVLLYILPFGVCVGYLNDPFHQWPLFSGYMALDYQMDPLVIRQMLTVGVIGIIGLATGTLLGSCLSAARPRVNESKPAKARTLGPFLFLSGLAVATLLSYLNAPKETIFQSSVLDQSISTTAKASFNAAWLISYLIIVILWIDAERDTWHGRRASWKFISIIVASLYIVIVLELLRGDREAIALVAALGGLYLTRARFGQVNGWRVQWKRVLQLVVPAVVVCMSFVMVGSARQQVATAAAWSAPNVEQLITDGLAASTWTGVLYTDLSLSGRYRHHQLQYVYGKTYLDYLLSAPPGFVARLLGYQRPMDLEQPAEWFYDIAGGGTYVTNVPFVNFGAPGVLLILACWGLLGVLWEIRGQEKRLWARLAYGTALAISFFWFWYGEMNLVRAFSISIAMYISYRVVTEVPFHRLLRIPRVHARRH